MKYKFGGTFILLLAGLLVLTIVFGSWYTIDQTQRGVLLRNGALVEVVQPGLHFKWPWIEAVYKIDMQTHNFTFDKVWGTWLKIGGVCLVLFGLFKVLVA